MMQARSLLFVPLTAPRFFANAAQRGADALILDLEDAVRPERKAEARRQVVPALDAIGEGGPPILVRLNAEPDLLAADIASLPMDRLDGLMLPKVEHVDQVAALAVAVAKAATRQRPEGAPRAPQPLLVALIETPLGVLRAGAIAAHPALAAVGFGAEDYAAAMGVEPEPDAMRWAAHQVANAARAYDRACWGLPGSVAVIEDMQAFADLVAQARRIGFSGTVCIHPRQVPVANAGFGPDEAQLAWARAVVEAEESAQATGAGAVRLNGRMLDRPIIARARRWLALGALAGSR